MHKTILPLALLISFTVSAQKFNIVPQPVSVKEMPGVFVPGKNAKTIFKIDSKSGLGPEGYQLSVRSGVVTVTASSEAGLFYGRQTLKQITPLNGGPIPCVEITDYPRFPWRGIMLDVSRHFFTKEEVKRFIDEAAMYKYNVFHWHLTDDNGWRIEIKGLPELTSKGSMRVERTGTWGNFQAPQPGEPATYRGYYTQDDIREVVAYAASKFITVLPEVDVPAHSLAMISAYPWLSSTGLQYPVNPGSRFYKVEDNVLDPGRDSVYLVMDIVFRELASLFPGKYIHVGGDEAYKGFWEKSPYVQKLAVEQHLTNMEEVQSYFIKRMEGILHKYGKQLIGWDEILEGGLAPDAAVMSWRGVQGGIEAARLHHKVVMSPTSNCYIDLYQGDPALEPDTYSSLRLRESYAFDPLPAGVDSAFVLGGQANLWTESVPTFRHAEYMTWPRGLALSEAMWSQPGNRSWSSFLSRLPEQLSRLQSTGVAYALSVYDPIVTVTSHKGEPLRLVLSSEIPGAESHYTFDNTHPDPFSPQFREGELSFPASASKIKVVVCENGKTLGKELVLTKEVLEGRAKK